eukprot:2539115-Pleurochrysis_carterae.AAC.1
MYARRLQCTRAVCNVRARAEPRTEFANVFSDRCGVERAGAARPQSLSHAHALVFTRTRSWSRTRARSHA